MPSRTKKYSIKLHIPATLIGKQVTRESVLRKLLAEAVGLTIGRCKWENGIEILMRPDQYFCLLYEAQSKGLYAEIRSRNFEILEECVDIPAKFDCRKNR